jgi:hypothetical protein
MSRLQRNGGRWRVGCGLASAMTMFIALGLSWQTNEALACGTFSAKLGTTRRPSLSYEQVVIVYDAKTSTEHFIREVTFNEGATQIGFVVPTPSRPEVAKVDAQPFNELRSKLRFAPEPNLGAFGHGSGAGTGQGYGSGRVGGGSVSVLETTKVGSFTAFVLAADDEQALATWLSDNDFSSSPEADEWLAHYVRLRFFYVAMRYDPPAPSAGREAPPAGAKPVTRGETIRISFATPAPYYPYLEPKPPTGLPAGDRLLEMWLVSNEPMTPVALVDADGARTWVRPLQPGLTHGGARDVAVKALGVTLGALVPEGPVTVQTFQDQKQSRAGFGDIVFVPSERRALDGARKAALLPLVALLDSTLMPAPVGGEK